MKWVISSGSNPQADSDSAGDVLIIHFQNSRGQWPPHHVKNLCLQHELTTSGEHYHCKDMSSDSDLETPMLYIMQSDNLPPASESTESDNDKGGDDTRNAENPLDIDAEVLLLKESLPPLRRSPH